MEIDSIYSLELSFQSFLEFSIIRVETDFKSILSCQVVDGLYPLHLTKDNKINFATLDCHTKGNSFEISNFYSEFASSTFFKGEFDRI
jgi:hypothetical protein